MITTTLGSEVVRVVNHPPDWVRPVSLRLALPVDIERGVTGRELRTPLDQWLRLTLSWQAVLDRAAANTLRLELHEAGAARAVSPCWPLAVPGAEWSGAPWSAGLVIGWLDDWRAHEISAALTDPAAWDWVAPATLGWLTAPEPEQLGPELQRVTLELTEAAPADYALQPEGAPTAGPALADTTTPPRWTLPINWREALRERPPRVAYEILPAPGPVREPGSVTNQQRPAQGVSGVVTCSGRAEIGSLLHLLWHLRLSARAHWIAAPAAITDLAADAAAGATSLTVTSGAALGDHRFLALTTAGATELVRVTTLAGDTLTLAAATAAAHPAATTLVSLALLARLARHEALIEFRAPELAEARLDWTEAADEYAADPGETRGATIGLAAVPAVLYEFIRDFGGVEVTDRATSHGRVVTALTHTWTPRHLDHGELRRTLRLDRDEVAITGRRWTDCPLDQFRPGALQAVVRLNIYEAHVDAAGVASAASLLWSGEVTEVEWDGPEFRASGAGWYAQLDARVPSKLAATACPNFLFDPACGLDRAAWTFTARVVSVSGSSVTLDTWARPGGLPTGWGFAHYFALGWIQRTVAGRPQRANILDSTALASGEITLTLDAVLLPGPVAGDAWSILPGCDKLARTCRAWHATENPAGKFANFLRFLGAERMSDKHPVWRPAGAGTAQGKK